MKSVNSFKRSAQSGFTLIELVVVIVILGILAATAIPKFSDMSSDARIAKLNAARAAVLTASSMFHAAWLAKGSSATATITMEGSTITHAFGYPTGDAAGIVEAAGKLSDYSHADAGGVVTITSDTTARTDCSFTYTAATSATSPAAISAVTTTGC